MKNYVPWMQINEYLLDVGEIRTPKEFCTQAIKRIYSLVPYDQARIYLLNDNMMVCDEVLFGVDKRWSDLYLNYYSKIENGRYSIFKNYHGGSYSRPIFNSEMYNWSNFECDEFISGYIIPQGINYTIGYGFCNANNVMKTIYCLDRTSRSGFTPEEVEIIKTVHPHLDNLHRNLFAYTLNFQPQRISQEAEKQLTNREAEIAALLCTGATPMKISQKLFISLTTVNRHIANIHQKLNVSNRQELLLKLMDSQIKI